MLGSRSVERKYLATDDHTRFSLPADNGALDKERERERGAKNNIRGVLLSGVELLESVSSLRNLSTKRKRK